MDSVYGMIVLLTFAMGVGLSLMPLGVWGSLAFLILEDRVPKVMRWFTGVGGILVSLSIPVVMASGAWNNTKPLSPGLFAAFCFVAYLAFIFISITGFFFFNRTKNS